MKLTIPITPELRVRLLHAQNLEIEVPEVAELVGAAERLVRHHLDAAEVHPCDDNNDEILARQSITEARDLYFAIKQFKGGAQ